ncbi:MAG: Unknown protein [uncultured Thiotrichaceae bacterium]|uniref:Flagellar assembly protein FliH n=1 Tax=uncultured Thiotrichaceae bacterium TaxID=298394 RepID=A0A6S6TGP0_9GAMM|nr:MAG: Unknown protein [uncultured Thiotrichaceae bacterium]
MLIKVQKVQENTLCIDPSCKVIKADEYLKLMSVQEIEKELLEERHQQQTQAASLKLKSIETGLNQGAEEAKIRLAEQLLSSAATMTNQLKDIEMNITDVVISAVRKIIDDYDDKDLVSAIVKQGLKPIYKGQKVSVRVHPEMMPRLIEELGLGDVHDESHFIDLIPEDQLAKTDCIIESDLGIVNASVDNQLEILTRVLEKKFKNSMSSQST